MCGQRSSVARMPVRHVGEQHVEVAEGHAPQRARGQVGGRDGRRIERRPGACPAAASRRPRSRARRGVIVGRRCGSARRRPGRRGSGAGAGAGAAGAGAPGPGAGPARVRPREERNGSSRMTSTATKRHHRRAQRRTRRLPDRVGDRLVDRGHDLAGTSGSTCRPEGCRHAGQDGRRRGPARPRRRCRRRSPRAAWNWPTNCCGTPFATSRSGTAARAGCRRTSPRWRGRPCRRSGGRRSGWRSRRPAWLNGHRVLDHDREHGQRGADARSRGPAARARSPASSVVVREVREQERADAQQRDRAQQQGLVLPGPGDDLAATRCWSAMTPTRSGISA